MVLRSFAIAADPSPLPRAVAALLADGRSRIDAYFARPGMVAGTASIPSDHELVYRTLRTLRATEPDARTFCEWGSGFGVVAGLAALLGHDAHGIELDPDLVTASRSLLRDHRLAATIVRGSFVPAGYAPRQHLADLDTRTVLSAPCAYDDMDLGLDDFAVIFAYPWPTEEDLYKDVFARYADYGAVLLTFSPSEGMRAYRKVGKGRS